MTVNQQVIEGSWGQVKGKLRERWGEISEDELEQARGNMDQLVGLIERRTGEARGEIEAYLESAAAEGEASVERAKEALANAACQASERAERMKDKAAESAQAGYVQTEQLVRKRPVESLAACFGAGLITGVVIGLLTRSR